MGEMNSSVTRVWPVFDCLLSNDPTGEKWLAPLLQLGSLSGNASTAIIEQPGPLLQELARFELSIPRSLSKVLRKERKERIDGVIRNCFERDIPPSENFLRWLLGNPGQLVWPTKGDEEKTYKAETQEKRKKLLLGDKTIRDEALNKLRRLGIARSKGKWWAFEGFTSVDCMLETERILLLIEGKRTEPISSSTDWFPQRNQVIRNLECAKEMAERKGKQYFVLLCAEERIEIPDSAWSASLPHFKEQAIEELRQHYLGCVTWSEMVQRLCPELQLPDTIDTAIDYCVSLRPGN